MEADKLKSEHGNYARVVWKKLGKMAFAAERKEETPIVAQDDHDRA
jgi:hypothetical protein